MRKVWTILTILMTTVTAVKANEFKFNYKNLNVLSAIICDQIKPIADKSELLFSKFSIDKTKMSQKRSDIKYEVSGICNAKYSIKNKEVLSYGEELQLEFNLKSLSKVSGTIGINPIDIYFSNNRITKINIRKIYEDKTETIKLNHVQWAKNNSLFTLNKNDLVKVKIQGRLLASEADSILVMNNGNMFYNFWSYDSFSCNSKVLLSQDGCEELSSKF